MLPSLVVLIIAQGPPPPATVLLIPLESSTQKASEEFKTPIPLTSPENGVFFDIDGDGTPEQVAWTQPDAPVAFLVLDKNKNGRIDDGREMIGTQTVHGASSAIRALIMLRAQDTPVLSGRLRHPDALYRKLLWWDSNHNGISEPSELRPASEFMTVIGLGYDRFNQVDDHGNLFRFQGWMELRTAPALNEATEPLDHQARLRNTYEVALRRR